MKFSKQVVTYLVTGSLGAGKTSFIKQILAQKPATEQWAVLVNEFGQIGLDKALLTGVKDEVVITEVAGGCLCCTGGAPFQVALSKLLEQAKPDVLFIELSGLGHPLPLLRQLTASPWINLLVLQPMIYLVDAQYLFSQIAVTDLSKQIGLVLANKAELINLEQKEIVNKLLAPLPIYWTSYGYLPITQLPKVTCQQNTLQLQDTSIITSNKPATAKLATSTGIEYAIEDQPEGWSIGWRFSTEYLFDRDKLMAWLNQFSWRRAKLVVQTNGGWLSINALQSQELIWKATEWRKDSRIELIFSERQTTDYMTEQLLSCLVTR